jgi:hypothetical protein
MEMAAALSRFAANIFRARHPTNTS